MLTALELSDRYGMLDRGEVALLKVCAGRLAFYPLVAVNIGAGAGTSALAVLEAQPEAFVFSVDRKEQREEADNLREAGQAGRVVRVLGNSAHVGWDWPGAVHLLFVDGNHDVPAVRLDVAAWLPKVSAGGVALFHDYRHPNLPELGPAVDELMRGHRRLGQSRFLVAFEVVR